MKELRRNMRVIGIGIICVFLILAISYALTAYTQGSTWAGTAYNRRTGGTGTLRGDIRDRGGILLATTNADGARVYVKDSAARRALSQTVGDPLGMSGTGVETFHSATLMSIPSTLSRRISSLAEKKQQVGSNVTLTIDAKLQAYVAAVFPKGYRGAVVVLNWKTGEILCMVSKPDYDPVGLDAKDLSGIEDTAFLNRCLQGLYTPGSVFKIVTLASALEHIRGITDESFTCSGIWDYGSSKVNCASNNAHGELTLKQAFAKSCNVTFGKIAYMLGPQYLRETAERFGFNENFKFGDFMIYNSQFPTSFGNDSDLIWSGVGQGTVLVTPLHMALIAASVANKGTMMKPMLILGTSDREGNMLSSPAPTEYRRVLTEEDADLIADYMRSAVKSGTASRAAIKGHTVCGKTGSAEVSNDKSVETNAWFTGFIREDDCPYAVAVVLENAGAGGSKAAPVAQKALEKAVELLGK